MPMTVRELVSQPLLRLDLLVRGDLERQIRWVHSSEMPDPGRYLQGGEVILSAGIWYWSGTEPSAFVESLVGARAAAMGFGVTPLHPTVPAELVEACHAAGLTLFGVPLNMAFVTISEAFIARYVADHERPLRHAMRRNQQLIGAVAEGRGIEGILQVIQADRKGSAFVVNRSRGTLAWTGEEPTAERVAEVLALTAAPRWPAGRSTLAIQPVPGAGSSPTYLVVEAGDDAEPLTSRALVDQALPYVALELQRDVAVRETERRIAGELFDLVMAGPAQLPAASSRLETLRLDPASRLIAVVADAAASDAGLDRLETAVADEGLRGLVAAKGAELWSVLAWNGADADVRPLAARLRAALGSAAALGVGRPADGAAHLRESLVEARQACRFARQRRGERVATFAEVGSYTFLLGLQDESTLRAFREAVLLPVLDYDHNRGTELMRTLELFLESGGEYAATATQLSIHVNTLRLRLARIETLTGRSLDRAEDRVDLYIALHTDV